MRRTFWPHSVFGQIPCWCYKSTYLFHYIPASGPFFEVRRKTSHNSHRNCRILRAVGVPNHCPVAVVDPVAFEAVEVGIGCRTVGEKWCGKKKKEIKWLERRLTKFWYVKKIFERLISQFVSENWAFQNFQVIVFGKKSRKAYFFFFGASFFSIMPNILQHFALNTHISATFQLPELLGFVYAPSGHIRCCASTSFSASNCEWSANGIWTGGGLALSILDGFALNLTSAIARSLRNLKICFKRHHVIFK